MDIYKAPDNCEEKVEPLVSIIIPAYNAEQFLSETLSSVLSQTYKNLEIIVIDDGSTDSTQKIAQSFGGCVSLLVQSHQGPSAARNLGVKHSKGEFIAFIDSDDIWVNCKLEVQLEYLLQNPGIELVYSDFARWYPNSERDFDSPLVSKNSNQSERVDLELSGWIYPEMLLDSQVWICTVVMRKSVWEAVGGMDESLRIGEDWDFFIKVSRKYEMTKLASVLAYYRMHQGSITNMPLVPNFAYKVVVNAISVYGYRGPDGRVVSRKLLNNTLYNIRFNHGYVHVNKGIPSIALSEFFGALLYRPFQIKVWGYIVLCMMKIFVQKLKYMK